MPGWRCWSSLVVGWPWTRREPSPVIVREPVEPFARQFVYFFAIVPALAATIVAVLAGWPAPVGGIAPLVVLSGPRGRGAGRRRHRAQPPAHRDRGLVRAAAGAAGAGGASRCSRCRGSASISTSTSRRGRSRSSFAESFQRRTGTPLQIVAGDPRTAALIALGAPSRPSLFLDATPERTPWVTFDDVRTQGRDHRVADHRHRRRAAAGDQGSAFPISSRSRRARSSGRCRAGCRCCASAGR